MSEGSEAGSRDPGWMRSRTGTAVTTAVAVAVISVLIMMVVLSPSMSPLASIRDTDGDGYPDSVDAFPDDPSEWSDTDGDGYGDNCDMFPRDPDFHAPIVDISWSSSPSVLTGAFGAVMPQFKWDDLAVTLSDGVDSVTWEPASDDLDDAESHQSKEYATQELGDIRVLLMVTDVMGDGWISFIDEMEIHADETVFAYDVEYNVTLSYEPTGSVLDESTVTITPFTPTITLSTVEVSGGYRFTFGHVNQEDLSWDSVTIVLSDGADEAHWTEIHASDLDDGEVDIHDYGARDLGDLAVTLKVMDLAGDGRVNAGDYLELTADSFVVGTYYSISVVYEPTGDECGSITFTEQEYTETPTTTLSKSVVTDGWRLTVCPITASVNWSDVTIVLLEGTSFVVWANITYDDLDGGTAVIKNYGTRTLGSLEVTLKIMDLSGNGYVNAGDFLELTGEFSMSTEYELRMMYEPTGSPMAITTFWG